MQLSPESVFILKSFGIAAAALYMLSLPLGLRSIHRFNRDVYLPAIRRWELSFMCQNCGATIEMPEKAAASAVPANENEPASI
jgi:hypothetical protein